MMNQDGKLELLYQQKQLPIFQNRMYDTEAEAKTCPKGDVRLVEDQQTGLVYNIDFCPELMAYDGHYQNEQAVSHRFRKHLVSVARILEKNLGRASIVEVGCGKGFFLEMLLAEGFDITGFDPAYEGNNPRILKHSFEPGVGIKASCLVLRHVLEHIQEPLNFLLQLKEANGGSGKIYIEVPCFDWICERRAWFDIYYEHVNYFRISDFYRMFGTVIECGRFFDGQYLYIVAELSTLKKPQINPKERVLFPSDFTFGIAAEPAHQRLGRSVIWGGASKGVIFALLKARSGQPVSSVIDINPAKQGKYLPSTGYLVQSPSEVLESLPKNSTIYVMNSNYLEEIKEMSHYEFNYIKVDYE